MAPEVRKRFTEAVKKIPKTVATEPFMTLLQLQERNILVRMEELKAQGQEPDGPRTFYIGRGLPKPT
jgi:hypothetical protein